ncbi:phosphotransferase [Paenibacillus athensensis]|uniref:Aminoglycoside phosphotransferase domain-containing protein n=1 Tax=Paenibacillus athensensis TaxID=1967502 RepID=A0A4Y8PSJ6_9BACL|nr:phosphotransferase [Paenibacillus athensensis]MCD1260551.1 phosphotransferase [Paenibacillus athensensis]
MMIQEELHELAPGLEATSLKVITDTDGRCWVIKTIDEHRAYEEASLIIKSNQLLKKSVQAKPIFPEIAEMKLGKISSYTMAYIQGETLEQYFQSLINPMLDEQMTRLTLEAVKKIKLLHAVSTDRYSSDYHKVIVQRRLEIILTCPMIIHHIETRLASQTDELRQFRFEQLQHFNLLFNNETHPTSRNLYDAAVQLYERNAPLMESLIHGDPHFGNIIWDQVNQDLIFIDPRCTWDNKSNTKTGYFDPLYDIASICHSFISNDHIGYEIYHDIDAANQVIHVADQALHKFELYLNRSLWVLQTYLGREPQPDELVRFIVYVACSLSGTMRYITWAPNIHKLITMYVYVYLFLHFAVAKGQSGIGGSYE